MFERVLEGAGWLMLTMAALGIVYCAATALAIKCFFQGARPERPARTEAVTLLKPLCGDEPRLEHNLRTFFDQDHRGPVQILFGLARTDDEAARAVASTTRAFPAVDVATVVSARRHGPSAKVSNLVNLHERATHGIVVLSDSDMSVGPDYLTEVLHALQGEGVGAVSLLYRGRGDAGFWSCLSAAGISYQFLPGAVFGIWSKLAAPCMGSTIAMRQDMLERIGTFAAFASHLADDFAIGQAVRREGSTVVVPPMLITHGCAENSFLDLWRHEVRWAATVRGVVPLQFLGSIVTHPLPLAIFGTLASQQYEIGGALVAATLLARSIQIGLVDRQVGAKTAPVWWMPLRDCLSFAVFIASLFARHIDWRGSRHRIETRGRLATDQEKLA